ncbi:MAG: hypothetical protein KGN77_05135 [Xanthomonadaceae bacterium]|nr:hypothetical protein [Xanthomonadaceae bacterium]
MSRGQRVVVRLVQLPADRVDGWRGQVAKMIDRGAARMGITAQPSAADEALACPS